MALDALHVKHRGYGLLAATREGGPMMRQLRELLKAVNLEELSSCTDEVELLDFVADSVGSAWYWQDPDDMDTILADDVVAEELRPVADALISAPASRWWPSPVALADQVFADWRPRSALLRQLTGAEAILRDWKQAALADEAKQSGSYWWSPPINAELANTTRRLSNLGAVGLLLLEDGMSDTSATCWSVRCREQPRNFEINGANEWIDLVKRYKLEVTWGRGDAWAMATGLDVRWFLPDWSQVADEFDAVHLSVSGYLAISGRPLLLDDDMATLVAGWAPDETYWLRDILEISGPGVEWESMQDHPSRDWRIALPRTD
jgi:hypothetical protein